MKKDEKVQMGENAQKLMEIIRSEKHSPCPSKREFCGPEDWIEVNVGFGRDETVSVQVHKETLKAFEEWEQEQDKNRMQCPRCEGHKIRTERRMNGDSECLDCWYKGKSVEFQPKVTDNVGQNKTKRKMGEIASTLRYLVGGEDFTTGRRITPVGVEGISKLAKRLRTLVDEYDKLVMDAPDNHCKD